MGTLSSTSTLDDAEALYRNSLTWRESKATALLHLEACEWIMEARPEMQSQRGTHFSFASLEKKVAKVEAFWNMAGTGSDQARFILGRTP